MKNANLNTMKAIEKANELIAEIKEGPKHGKRRALIRLDKRLDHLTEAAAAKGEKPSFPNKAKTTNPAKKAVKTFKPVHTPPAAKDKADKLPNLIWMAEKAEKKAAKKTVKVVEVMPAEEPVKEKAEKATPKKQEGLKNTDAVRSAKKRVKAAKKVTEAAKDTPAEDAAKSLMDYAVDQLARAKAEAEALKAVAQTVGNGDVNTDEKVAAVLVAAGVPVNLALDVALVFPVVDIRKIVDTEDYDALTIVKGVGLKRAEMICTTLKGRIPGVLSKEQIKVPNPEIHKVPNMNLYVDGNGNATITANKVRRGKVVLDKEGNPVKDVALKRYGPILQKAAEIAGSDEKLVFTTISQVKENFDNPAEAIEAREKWHDTVMGHFTVGMKEYVAAVMGTNANMRCQIHWLEKQVALAVRTWALCGAKVRKNTNIAKLEAYIGLLLPYTKKLLGGVLSPRMEALIPEWNNTHKGENMLIHPNGDMQRMLEFVVSEFDGMAVLELTDELIAKMHLTKAQEKKLRELIAKCKGGTLRAPFQKGALICGFPIHEVLRRIGVTHVNGKPIEEIAIFGDMTVFKAAIGDDGLYRSFEEYCLNFEQLKHRFGLLLENHGVRETYLPAQQLQAAHGCDKRFIEQGGAEEVEYLKAAQDPKVAAARYLPKHVAEIAQEDPRIAGVWFAQHIVRNGYVKEMQESLSGATHANSLTGLVIKDLIAFCQWIAYCAGVRKELPTGCLKAYQVLCPMGGYTGEAVASRNPVIAKYGLVRVDVIEELDPDNEWAWAFKDLDFMMVSIHDDLCKRLRMDHDGDKMRLTTAKWFVDAVKSIAAMPFAEWETFGEAVKNMCTWEDVQEFFATRTQTPSLGANVNFAGQVIALGLIYGIVESDEAEWLMDYMMNKGTDVKQGADGSSCEGKAGEIWKKLREGLKALLDSGVAPYTIAQAYGKFVKGEAPDSDKVAKTYGDSNLDIISKAVKEGAPRSIVMPGGFPTTDVLISKRCCIKGLVGSGTKEKNYEDAGLFNKLVSMGRDAFAQMDDGTRETGGYADFVAYKRQVALDEFQKFADENGVTMVEVYDCITTYIFDRLAVSYNKKTASKAAKDWYIVLAVTYLTWFGDKLEETYCANKALGFLKAVQPQTTCADGLFDF